MVLMKTVCTLQKGEAVAIENVKEKHIFEKTSIIRNGKIIDSFFFFAAI